MPGFCDRKYGEIRLKFDKFLIICDSCNDSFTDLSMFVQHMKVHLQREVEAIKSISNIETNEAPISVERNKLHKFNFVINAIESNPRRRGLLPLPAVPIEQCRRASILPPSCLFECLQLRCMAEEPQRIISKYFTIDKHYAFLKIMDICANIVQDCKLQLCSKTAQHVRAIEQRLGDSELTKKSKTAFMVVNRKIDCLLHKHPLYMISLSQLYSELQKVYGTAGSSTMCSMKVFNQLNFMKPTTVVKMADLNLCQLSLLSLQQEDRFDIQCWLTDDISDISNDGEVIYTDDSYVTMRTSSDSVKIQINKLNMTASKDFLRGWKTKDSYSDMNICSTISSEGILCSRSSGGASIEKHTGEKPYHCHVCRKTFRTLSAIIEHISLHAKDRIYKCNDCGRCFHSRPKLMVHINTHAIVRVYKCNECGRTFESRKCQRIHQMIHSTERRAILCKLCGKSFQHFTARYNHMRLMHKRTPEMEIIKDQLRILK